MKKNCCGVYHESDTNQINLKQYQICQTILLKKELHHAAGVDTSNLATKKDFAAFKADVEKFDIIKFVNVSSSLKTLKTKVYYFNVGKLKTVPIVLTKIKRCSR